MAAGEQNGGGLQIDVRVTGSDGKSYGPGEQGYEDALAFDDRLNALYASAPRAGVSATYRAGVTESTPLYTDSDGIVITKEEYYMQLAEWLKTDEGKEYAELTGQDITNEANVATQGELDYWKERIDFRQKSIQRMLEVAALQGIDVDKVLEKYRPKLLETAEKDTDGTIGAQKTRFHDLGDLEVALYKAGVLLPVEDYDEQSGSYGLLTDAEIAEAARRSVS